MLKAIFKILFFSLLLTLLTSRVFAIDPELIFFDHFGGSADDFGYATAVDSEGNKWITGKVTKTAFSGGVDVFIAKFSPTGELLLWIDFGGSGTDYAKAIAIGANGNICIAGGTDSSDLPLTSGGCNGPSDGFIAVFDSEGNLIWCDYFGEDAVDSGRGIAVGYNGDIYIVGYSSGNAFIAKFGPMGGLIFFIPFGGKGFDIAYGVAIDYNGDIYVIGETGSSENEFLVDGLPFHPSVFDGVFDNIFNGGVDVFVAKFNSLGILLRFTFLGGPYSETGFAIDVYLEGVYVTGTAFSGFPYKDAYRSGSQNSMFVSKLDLTLTHLEWSAKIGGRRSDYGFAIKVDSKGYPWVIGHSYSDNSGKFPTTDNAFNRIYSGGVDIVMVRLDPSGKILVYASYFGGPALDSGRGIALNEVDEVVHVCIVGYTESPEFLSPKSLTNFGLYNADSYKNADNDKGAEIFVAIILFPSVADLTISTTPGGTTDPISGTHIYDLGTEVEIEAIPGNGYRFDKWSGDVSAEEENDNPITIVMYWDKFLTPIFIRQYTLTVSAGTGGTTNPWPETYIHDEGTEVTITATPNDGYAFTNWSGDATGTTNPITIAMDSDKSVKADFEKEGCFIATAAYDSFLHPYVKILRDFRDKYLMSNKLGQKLVKLYYKYSPFIAKLIAQNKVLKITVRIALLPLIGLSYLTVY